MYSQIPHPWDRVQSVLSSRWEINQMMWIVYGDDDEDDEPCLDGRRKGVNVNMMWIWFFIFQGDFFWFDGEYEARKGIGRVRIKPARWEKGILVFSIHCNVYSSPICFAGTRRSTSFWAQWQLQSTTSTTDRSRPRSLQKKSKGKSHPFALSFAYMHICIM